MRGGGEQETEGRIVMIVVMVMARMSHTASFCTSHSIRVDAEEEDVTFHVSVADAAAAAVKVRDPACVFVCGIVNVFVCLQIKRTQSQRPLFLFTLCTSVLR